MAYFSAHVASLRSWLLVLGLSLGLARPGFAQLNRYLFSQAPGTYVPLGTGRTVAIDGQLQLGGNLGPAVRLPAGALPFAFPYNGRRYTSGYIDLKGYLTLGPGSPVTTSPPLPFDPISEPTPYDGALAPLASDLAYGSTLSGPWAEVSYQTLGAAPARTFVVQWDRMYNNSSGPFAFQLRLHETTGVIEFAYGAFAYTNLVPGPLDQAQVGLRGTSPVDFANRTGTWAASTAGLSPLAELVPQAGNSPAGLVYTYTPAAPEACPRPFSLEADSVEATSARVRWRTAGGGGSFTLRYGPTGFDPNQPTAGQTVTVPAGDSTYRITGLSAFTPYDFYLAQNCGGAAGTSVLSNPKGTFQTLLANDNPSGAIALPLNATCVPTAGTTVGATATVPNGWAPQDAPNPSNCNYNTPYGFDVWYRFTTDASGPGSQTVQLTVTGTGVRKLSVLAAAGAAGAAGPLQTLGCSLNYSNGQLGPFVVGGLAASTTYYVRVAVSGAARAAFAVCASYPPGCGDPLNVAVGSITATSASLSFTPSSGSPTSYTVAIAPAGTTPVPLVPNPTASPVPLPGLTPGTTYRVTLQANCGTGGQSAVITRGFTTPVLNDEPATATALPLSATCLPTLGTTNGATASGLNLNSPCTTGTSADVWYTFTTAATGPTSTAVRLTLTSPAGSSYVLTVANSAIGAAGPFTFVSCGPNTALSPHLDLAGLTPGTTYYVQVRQFTGLPATTFSLCATPVPVITCDVPANLAVSTITPTTAQVSWQYPGLNGLPTSYEVVYTAQGGARQLLAPAPTASPVTLMGLTPATYYTVRLRSNCGSGGYSAADSVRFRTAGAPANDRCAGAQPLTCGQQVLSSLAGATADTATCAAARPAGPGVWYAVTGANQTMTIHSCPPGTGGPQYNTIQLSVFTGRCGALRCEAFGGIDSTCFGQAFHAVTFAALAGQTYYVLVNSPSQGTPDFVLTTTCVPLLATRPAAALAAQVQLYPNPAHATATLELPAGLGTLAGPAVLHDALGRALRQLALPAGTHRAELDLTGLPAGVYSLHLRTAQGQLVKRLVVE